MNDLFDLTEEDIARIAAAEEHENNRRWNIVMYANSQKREMHDLPRNGSCFIANGEPVVSDIYETDMILTNVHIWDDYGEYDEELPYARMIPVADYANSGGWWFVVNPVSNDEIFKIDVTSKFVYFSMMTAIPLEGIIVDGKRNSNRAEEFFASLKKWYHIGSWSDLMVQNAVRQQWIDTTVYKEITGKDYHTGV